MGGCRSGTPTLDRLSDSQCRRRVDRRIAYVGCVSEVVTRELVLGSIVMFGLIYVLLFALWVFLLDRAIRRGPESVGVPEPSGSGDDALSAITARAAHGQSAGQPQRRVHKMDLNLIWFMLLGVLLAGYAVLDGFDLGVGMLHLLARGDDERRTLIATIGPIWDGNEVWLVTFGGALFAAFPEAYATVFSGFYIVFMLVLLALICPRRIARFSQQDRVPCVAQDLGYRVFPVQHAGHVVVRRGSWKRDDWRAAHRARYLRGRFLQLAQSLRDPRSDCWRLPCS